MMTRTLALGLALLGGCTQSVHLQADFGDAYQAAMDDQANRARPEVSQLELQLSGTEGLLIRAQAAAEVSDMETGQAEYLDKD
jgi:predicted nucleic acid-binding protein